ncbi:MAG: AMP-binding protein [Acidobacteria bacterium]|nr:AMP-binding protein [Acidobacteriota bacterium]
MRRDTLLDFFQDLAKHSEPFLIYDDGFRSAVRTYAETASAARAFAGKLRAAGVGEGGKVLIWSENRCEWIVAFWGCLLAGAVLVPIDYRASVDMVRRVRDKVGASVTLVGAEVEYPDHGASVWRLDELDWTGAASAPSRTAARDDVAEIIFTSGATSDPKGVLISHRNILANIVPVENEVLKYRKYGKPFYPIRFLNLLPLSHMFGQAMATFIPPMLAGVVVFVRGYNPREIVRQIHDRRISVLVSVPKILEILRDHVIRLYPETAQDPGDKIHWLRRWWRYRRVHRLFGWKFWALIVGAAPLPSDLEEFWSRLGYIVIQGYGLTETAPIVTLNHPFHARKGTVGSPIGGIEVRIAEDGEILVRGENVTRGYYDAPDSALDAEGWLHTGDIGAFDAEHRLTIRGRKKEMIVTPEGLNVFPEDIERVLNRTAGVRDSAVVGADRPHAVLVLVPGADPADAVRQANAELEDHQRVRGFSVWTTGDLPRTEGTAKLKRHEIARWVAQGGAPAASAATPAARILARYAHGRDVSSSTTLDELGLSSLERVELMMELDVSESHFQSARTVGDLLSQGVSERRPDPPPADDSFPRWNRTRAVSMVRNVSLATWILPIGRIFAWIHAEGLENLRDLEPPVIFAPNHQSHLDVPAILMALPWKWRKRVAPAMAKEFFAAHFHPDRYPLAKRLTNSLNYYLSTFFFNAFPLPQRESGALDTLRYAGELAADNYCVLIFPEGKRTQHGEIHPFQPGIGMMASRLGIPVIPVRITGADKVLHQSAKMAAPGRVSVKFGKPLRLSGPDYAALAHQVEEAVRQL